MILLKMLDEKLHADSVVPGYVRCDYSSGDYRSDRARGLWSRRGDGYVCEGARSWPKSMWAKKWLPTSLP